MANEIDTESLIERLRRDDVAALDELLRRFWAPVLAYLRRWLGSADTAEDVAQRTFLRLWERRRDWDPRGSLQGLIFSIARNLAISDQRNQGARGRAQARFLTHNASPERAAALDAVEQQELGRTLDAAIQALPERRREVFVLRCVHGLSYAEIAELMGISQQTVANQLSRALTTLRAELAHLLDD